jgi:hypothetical protein
MDILLKEEFQKIRELLEKEVQNGDTYNYRMAVRMTLERMPIEIKRDKGRYDLITKNTEEIIP